MNILTSDDRITVKFSVLQTENASLLHVSTPFDHLKVKTCLHDTLKSVNVFIISSGDTLHTKQLGVFNRIILLHF